MTAPFITLTTDFGEADSYVAAMKGVILSINPAARLMDLGHQLPPQDVVHAAFFLAGAVPYFPPGSLHVVVVDPGVGTDRALLYAELGAQRLLAPDNGVLTLLERSLGVRRLFRLAESRFWRADVSRTFHGRDILAPVAAHLSLGVRPEELGPALTELHRLKFPEPRADAASVRGEVVDIDRFGNLITNIPASLISERTSFLAEVCGRTARSVPAYADASPGELVVLVSSSGLLEVALNQGNGARELAAKRGAAVILPSQ
jgi:hypothetical protein